MITTFLFELVKIMLIVVIWSVIDQLLEQDKND
jgi:hypothetical protein